MPRTWAATSTCWEAYPQAEFHVITPETLSIVIPPGAPDTLKV